MTAGRAALAGRGALAERAAVAEPGALAELAVRAELAALAEAGPGRTAAVVEFAAPPWLAAVALRPALDAVQAG